MAESYVVIGGEGFLGHHLVTALERAYPLATVTSLDTSQRFHPSPSAPLKHSFELVDLTDTPSLVAALQHAAATTVFHTASPWTGSGKAVCEKVNVHGTRSVVEACQKVGVKTLVYTSSASVVFTGKDVIGVDERLPYAPERRAWDAYNLSKAKAEAIVLKANGENGLATVSIRPAGIFGPGDRQAIPGMIQVLKEGKHRFQIGSNNNLFDWTHVDNVVHGHLLAAERIGRSVPISELDFRKPPVSLTLPRRTLPTSEKVEGATESTDIALPARRSRFDQFSSFNLDPLIEASSPSSVPGDTDDASPLPTIAVAGSSFFVTGGEPIFFWDFARSVWTAYLGHPPPRPWVLPQWLVLLLVPLVTLASWISKKEPTFTTQRVVMVSVNRWHNIERARVVLGYEPVVGVEEGVRTSVEWFKANEAAQAAARAQ